MRLYAVECALRFFRVVPYMCSFQTILIIVTDGLKDEVKEHSMALIDELFVSPVPVADAALVESIKKLDETIEDRQKPKLNLKMLVYISKASENNAMAIMIC